jgi:hypothetical protein
MLHCSYCSAVVSEFTMNDLVDRVLRAYQMKSRLDLERVVDSRRKISRYLESLATSGQRDLRQLTLYGLAYLTELHDGRDPRFTGC